MIGLLLYTNEDGASRIQLRADGETVWLTQEEMAALFDVTAENIRQHLKNIFSDKELEAKRASKDSLVVQQEGGRQVCRPVTPEAGIDDHWLGFDEQRMKEEARAIDAADEAELAALEGRIRKRKKP